MKFSVSSDLHIDFYTTHSNNKILRMFEKSKNLVSAHLIAGDVSNSALKTAHFCQGIEKSIYIRGNHEYYDCMNKIEDDIKLYEIDGCKIVAGTLWTDFNGMNPLTILRLREYMHDSSKILDYNEEDIARINKLQKEFIFDNNPDVVMTHHAPSISAIEPKYRALFHENGGYANNLDYSIMDSKIKLWVFGHSHSRLDMMIGNTRVVSNCRGYPSESNHFKLKIVEI